MIILHIFYTFYMLIYTKLKVEPNSFWLGSYSNKNAFDSNANHPRKSISP